MTSDGVVKASPQDVTERLAVPGGWLVRSVRYYARHDGGGVGVGLTFVPDPQGAWQPVSPFGNPSK